MMFLRSIFGAGFLLNLVFPALGVVHEQLASVPDGWTKIKDADTSTPISLTIALQIKNLDNLESKLIAVSTPGSPEYGKHLDLNDTNALFPAASDENVISWLRQAGVSNINSTRGGGGGSVRFATTVGTANKLLNASFAYYSNGNGTSKTGSAQKLRTTQYSIPDNLVHDIELILPTTYFGKKSSSSSSSSYSAAASGSRTAIVDSLNRQTNSPPTKAENASVYPSCRQGVSPACLKEMYNVGHYVPDPASGSRVGFSSFTNQSAILSDLHAFEQRFGIPTQNFSVELINGAVDNQDLATATFMEANLDSQTLVGIGNPLPVVEFITGGAAPYTPNLDEPASEGSQNEPFIAFYEYLLSKPNSELPQVISNSYGDDEQTVPEFYAKRTCNLIGLMGVRGISVLESSGDLGVGSPCQSNDGKKKPEFTPQFPGTCPYVTVVGGTQEINPEAAWVASSGGFSNYFPRPWYQEAAVEGYLTKQVDPETRKYYSQFANFTGRGFPDVAAHSSTPSYEVVQNGTNSVTGGTSAATPTFAAILALLNDARLRAGKSTLGFLNPFLYALGQKGLKDITLGGSNGCTGTDLQHEKPVPGASIIQWAHWNATSGWDPATGLGTPDFGKLKGIVMKL